MSITTINMLQFFSTTANVQTSFVDVPRAGIDIVSILLSGGLVVAGIIILWILLLLLRYIFKKTNILPSSLHQNVFLITLPKEAAEDEDGQAESIQKIQEKIGVAEAFLSTVGGLKAQKGLKAWLFGRADYLAFEIVAHKGLISFYAAAPHYLERYLEQQIHAHYPDANIEKVKDYNIFKPRGVIRGAFLSFKRSYIFPLKTYKNIEADSLNALTNAMAKLNEGDGLAIQIVARSARSGWHNIGAKVVTEMQQGKTADQALKAVSKGVASKTLKLAGDLFSSNKKEQELTQPKPLPVQEELVKGIQEKIGKAGLDVNIRVLASADNEAQANIYLDGVTNAFAQFNLYEHGNTLSVKKPRDQEKITKNFIFRNFNEKRSMLLGTEELASIFHFPLPSTDTPNIQWLLARKAAPPVNMPVDGLILGKSVYRGEDTIVRIKDNDRRRHMYVIGKSGSGKSWLIANMARQDIQNGHGVCVVDPHGDLVQQVLEAVPKERADDVIIFDPSDLDRPLGLNMLEVKDEAMRDFAVQEMISIFYKLFPPEMIGPMFEHTMRNVMLTLMSDPENPGTIAEIPRMITDEAFQKEWIAKVKDPAVRSYWENEVANTSDFHKSEMFGYLVSKVGRFVENEMMRNIIGQSKSGFDFRDIMDNKKILLVNLAKGKTGEVNSELLGLIIVTKLQMAALGRADMPEEKRHDFYLYIDEFQNFVTPSIATILSEARKYKLNLIIAHQYIGQLVQNNDTQIRDAVFGNAGTMVSFRIGTDDTETMVKEFAPVVSEYDLLNSTIGATYIKLLIDGAASKAFNMNTMVLEEGDKVLAEKIKELSRLKFGRDKAIVEAEILERTQISKGGAVSIADKTL